MGVQELRAKSARGSFFFIFFLSLPLVSFLLFFLPFLERDEKEEVLTSIA